MIRGAKTSGQDCSGPSQMTHWTTISGQVCLSYTQDHQKWGVGWPLLYYLLSVMVLCIGEAVLGIFLQEENAQDWSCDGPEHLLWCHMSPVMFLCIRKAVLGIFL